MNHLILNTLDATLFVFGQASDSGKEKFGADASNTVIMSTGPLDWDQLHLDGNIDRSPCGSGTSAVMAAMYVVFRRVVT